MKTHSESRIEPRNPQILKKIREKSNKFLSSEQPCEQKNVDVVSNIAGVEKYPWKLVVAVNLAAIEWKKY